MKDLSLLNQGYVKLPFEGHVISRNLIRRKLHIGFAENANAYSACSRHFEIMATFNNPQSVKSSRLATKYSPAWPKSVVSAFELIVATGQL